MIDPDAIDQVLPLEDVKRHLNVEEADDDELIQNIVYVAVETIESETGHLIGQRTVSEHFRSFDAIRLRSWPIQSVAALAYFDESGNAVSLDPATARLSAAKRPGRLILTAGAWPAAMTAPDAVTVSMQAGHDPDAVPHRLRHAALVMVSDLYDKRESWTPGSASKVPLSLPVERLLASFETWSI
jgi:uncharacterized phiE125 gp8 family phage protein